MKFVGKIKIGKNGCILILVFLVIWLSIERTHQEEPLRCSELQS